MVIGVTTLVCPQSMLRTKARMLFTLKSPGGKGKKPMATRRQDRAVANDCGYFKVKRRLILHIGAHRTATSALQAYFHDNFSPLKAKGFFYPFKVRRHLKLINQLFSGNRSVQEAAATITKRADHHPEHIHTVILSDEDICMREDLSLLGQFRDTFDVQVAFTLRRQDTWLESWFLQNIKWQWNEKLSHCSLVEFMAMRNDFHWIHYDRYVRHLEAVFGRENVILNIHEKQQMQGGPIETFCNSIGLTDRAGLVAPVHINESFSPKISEFMRCLPLDKAQVQYRNMLTSACASIDQRLNGSGRKQSERIIPHADRLALMQDYQGGNRSLAQRHFNRDQLFLEPLPGPDAPLADMSLPTNSYQLMEQFVAPLLEKIINHQKAT